MILKQLLSKNTQRCRKYYTVTSNMLNKKDIEAQKSLSKQLRNQIKATGPITVAAYMKQVLTNPLSGYYMHNDVFGQAGDFVTSPELGQLFGEIVAVWFLSEWKKIGSPKPFQIVEMGPGRGSLCNDMIRVFKHFNELEQCSVSLVEVSPLLKDLQSKKLCLTSQAVESTVENPAYYRGFTSTGLNINWYNRLQDVPKKFSLYLAHEFFDALPIHKYQKTEKGFREVLIDNDPSSDDKFRYVLSNSELLPSINLLLNGEQMKDYQNAEVSTESVLLVEHLADRIEQDGGIALIADYGKNEQPGDTFRAFKKHQLHDPLVEPGSADLTADVDFNLLKSVAMERNRCISFGPVSQHDFLTSMGMEYRLEQLLQNANTEEQKSLQFAYDMMTDPKQMGERFKLLSLFPYVLKSHLEKFPVMGFS